MHDISGHSLRKQWVAKSYGVTLLGVDEHHTETRASDEHDHTALALKHGHQNEEQSWG